MKHIYMVTLFIVTLFASGCRKEMPELLNPKDNLNATSWNAVFKPFWTGMNNNYVFWDVDPTDWDAVYRKYAPLFDTLSFTQPYGKVLAQKYFTEMTSTLIDHHFELSFPRFGKEMRSIQPGAMEMISRDYYHNALTYEQYETVFTKNASRISSFQDFWIRNDEGQITFYAHSYLLDGKIAYFRFSAFMLRELTSAKGGELLVNVLANFYDILHQSTNLKGVIIDTRSNYGGNVYDLDWSAGLLVSERHLFAETRTKSGMGRLDYSPWIPMYVSPFEKGVTPPDVPVVSLVDVNSASMGEIIALAIRSLPRGVVIGERTIGATGPLADNIYFMAGTFANSAIVAKTSSCTLRTLEGEILEGKGVTPDIIELYNEASFNAGVDNQLERAVRYINTGN